MGDGLSRREKCNHLNQQKSPRTVAVSTRFAADGIPLFESRQTNCPYEFSCILRHSNRFFFGVFQPTFFWPDSPDRIVTHIGAVAGRTNRV